ncbi:hypothetical protein [Buchnera aphidicola]|uniref:hypothetical protein n=1 Tax=Buchnera aphidicola TaxID=9 RepID=UPI001F375ED4|nr:hypothetical protein [Buchnera aphidicola]
MKNLINTITNIKKILISLEQILNQEYNSLSNPHKKIDSLKTIIKKKKFSLKNISL